MTTPTPHSEFQDVTISYGKEIALRDISLTIPEQTIFSIIGPANAVKTTFLKSINRTLEFEPNAKTKGTILVHGTDISQIKNVYSLRRRIGMVFPLPVGLPLSVYENVAYAPRRAGIHDRQELDELIERCLKQSMLWDEVKDRLNLLGTKLSGGQQQRLTIARALSHKPEILCLDEFSIAIDPVTTMKIEDVLLELKKEMTIILVTNLVQQARRLADHTAFFNKSKMIEVGPTEKIFSNPEQQLTHDYVTGDFG
jgi:phosphate transport system ATP-binding protein